MQRVYLDGILRLAAEFALKSSVAACMWSVVRWMCRQASPNET